MNRTDRLLAIVWLLRTRRKMKAEELAAVFAVTPRSIYRDVQALMEANVPVISLPGPDGGYSLMKEYSVTPITFSDPEVSALFLSAGFLQAMRLEPYQAAIRSAVEKIARVLPEGQVSKLRTLQQSILPDLPLRGAGSAEAQHFQTLQQALVERRTVQAAYRSPDSEDTERQLDPYGLIFQSGYWYAIAYCHLRQSIRMFRLDRFRDLRPTDRTFERPAEFPLDPFLFRHWADDELKGPRVPVRLAATPDQAAYLTSHPLFGRCNPRQEAGVLMLDIPERSANYFTSIVLYAGGRLQVLEPESMKQRIREAAAGLARAHT